MKLMGYLDNKWSNSEFAYTLYKESKKMILYTQYQVIHELQLEKIRRKVQKGEKIRVLFLVVQASKFGYDSILRSMQHSDIFEPFILVASHYDSLFESEEMYLNMAKSDYETISKMGYETYFAYDEYGNPTPMWEFKPDIVFYNELSDMGYYKVSIINREFLTCFVSYGMTTANRGEKQYRKDQRNSCWKMFLESRYVYEEYARHSCINGMNAILTGYPKLDEYAGYDSSIQYEAKDGRKLVIYAPHWSIRDKGGYNLNFATFPIYYKKMMDLVKANPSVDFVLKPHPRLGICIKELEGQKNFPLTYVEYEAYLKEWDSLNNGSVVMDGDYISLFKKSSCMIMDSGSFISEYLPSGHPCIYLLNPHKKNPLSDYNEFSRAILKTYYCCTDWVSVDRLFHDIIYNDVDEKKEARKRMEKKLVNVGCAGEKIVKYIENEIGVKDL